MAGHFSYINMSEEQCLTRPRFHKGVVTELCHLLHTDLEARLRTRTLPSVAVKVTVALNVYATGWLQAPAGDSFNIPCIRQVTGSPYSRHTGYTNFSMLREELEERSCGLPRTAGFPMVQGATGCTHVALRAPPQNAEVYRDRKVLPLAQCPVGVRPPQAAHPRCGCPLSWQCSLHPAGGHCATTLPAGCSATKATWLMTPLCNPTSPAEQRHNQSHGATRDTVDQTIRVLKQRFCCLDRSGGSVQYSPDRVSIVTVDCCMLHNLSYTFGEQGASGLGREAHLGLQLDVRRQEQPAFLPSPAITFGTPSLAHFQPEMLHLGNIQIVPP
uniref:putative nuclease HARBI1 n=1 Tax=Pristiophorus japonicus TaxID=55135 RepID=UPI00398EA877